MIEPLFVCVPLLHFYYIGVRFHPITLLFIGIPSNAQLIAALSVAKDNPNSASGSKKNRARTTTLRTNFTFFHRTWLIIQDPTLWAIQVIPRHLFSLRWGFNDQFSGRGVNIA
jgi:hypothetical protein